MLFPVYAADDIKPRSWPHVSRRFHFHSFSLSLSLSIVARKRRFFRAIRCEIRSRLRRRYTLVTGNATVVTAGSSCEMSRRTRKKMLVKQVHLSPCFSFYLLSSPRARSSSFATREWRTTQIWTSWRPVKYTEHWGEADTSESANDKTSPGHESRLSISEYLLLTYGTWCPVEKELFEQNVGWYRALGKSC